MNSNWLEIDNLDKRFSGLKALDNVSFSVKSREIVGLLGPNGAGKTTLFNIITGFSRSDGGTVFFRGTDLLALRPDRIASLGIARTFQQLRLIRQLTVLENVLLAFNYQLGENLGNLFFRSKQVAAKETKHRETAILMLKDAGLGGKLKHSAEDLSYGQQKLLSIVCCLATGADLLLLDEPVAGLSPAMIDQMLLLIRGLPQQGKSILLIEHNVDAMMEVCDRLLFLDAGTLITQGTPEQVRSDPRVIAAYLR